MVREVPLAFTEESMHALGQRVAKAQPMMTPKPRALEKK